MTTEQREPGVVVGFDTANTRAWGNALTRAGIKNFRWHGLRRIWATWHVMAGTTMAELQELGAWKAADMVERCAHCAAAKRTVAPVSTNE